jgi:hypothetical protein
MRGNRLARDQPLVAVHDTAASQAAAGLPPLIVAERGDGTAAGWPDDWPEIAAAHGGGDDRVVAKELKRLQRFADPAALYGATRATCSTATPSATPWRPAPS